MIKTLITELERARTIMGLKPKSYGLLNEQGGLYDDIIKAFSRKTISKEAAEQLSIRLSNLLSRTSTTKLGNIFNRMTKVGNMKTTKGGTKYIISETGSQFKFSDIQKIIAGVADGSISGDKLQKMIDQLPERLADGTSFKKSFGDQMKLLEKKVTKDAAEKTKVKTDDAEVKTDTETYNLNKGDIVLFHKGIKSVWTITSSFKKFFVIDNC